MKIKIRVNFWIIYFEFYPFIFNKWTQRLLHFHLGFDDRSLFWMVHGKLYDLFFFKIKDDWKEFKKNQKHE